MPKQKSLSMSVPLGSGKTLDPRKVNPKPVKGGPWEMTYLKTPKASTKLLPK